MQEISVVWSLPWHALQRTLAQRSGFGIAHDPAPAPRGSAQVVRTSANSWLTRALHREYSSLPMNL